MPDFRRYYIPHSIVFITAVTRDRLPYLAGETNVGLFFDTLRRVRETHPFRLLAYVVMPDHFHWLMRTDERGAFSAVLHSLKRNYTINFKKVHDITTSFGVWQARFWDHIIRSERDLANHVDYIHYNPVRHGHVSRSDDWPHSTYCHWLERGYYSPGWGSDDRPSSIAVMDLE